MSVSSGFFNSFNHDRTYNAEQISSMFDGVFSDGVFATYGNAFAVNASSGFSVTVDSGRAWFNHRWIYNDAPIQVEFPVPDLLRPRYDALVIEIDSSESGRIGSIKVVVGEPNTVPQKPVLVKSETINQYPLAYIYRESNSTSIATENIEVRIGTSECPYITGLIEAVSADNFLAQWQSQFDIWTADNQRRTEDLEKAIEDAKQGQIIEGSVSQIYEATIGTIWEESDPYMQTIPIAGLQASDKPIVDMVPSDDFETAVAQIDAYGSIYRMVVGQNTLTVYSTDKTEVEIPIQIRAVRK